MGGKSYSASKQWQCENLVSFLSTVPSQASVITLPLPALPMLTLKKLDTAQQQAQCPCRLQHPVQLLQVTRFRVAFRLPWQLESRVAEHAPAMAVES